MLIKLALHKERTYELFNYLSYFFFKVDPLCHKLSKTMPPRSGTSQLFFLINVDRNIFMLVIVIKWFHK